MASQGLNLNYQQDKLLLPLGISFYTFQSLSYTIDIYRKKNKPAKSLSDFALFVAFFPQLIAGPIVKARKFIPQLTTPKIINLNNLYWGLLLTTIGLFQKAFIADILLSPIADRAFDNYDSLSTIDAWLGVLAFSGQILCDFGGYSLIAIGTAYCLGFKLPRNFNAPYAAVGFSDFWRRWHISLSSWLKEYAYISLGGNRISISRTYINLLVTMIIGGLWHGAGWTFVVWGALHGLFLIIERLIKSRISIQNRSQPIVRNIASLLTYLLILFTWVFFRSPDLPAAFGFISSMFGNNQFTAENLNLFEKLIVISVMAGILASQYLMRNKKLRMFLRSMPFWLLNLFWILLICILFLSHGASHEFIYFQF